MLRTMDDESLFASHARFRADQEVPEGWYHAGEAMGEDAWVVDLDLFVEVKLDAAAWEAVLGDVLQLAVGDTTLDLDVPADASLEECWALPGMGLFEPAAGVTDKELTEAEADDGLADLGRYGDLFVLPIVLEA